MSAITEEWKREIYERLEKEREERKKLVVEGRENEFKLFVIANETYEWSSQPQLNPYLQANARTLDSMKLDDLELHWENRVERSSNENQVVKKHRFQ